MAILIETKVKAFATDISARLKKKRDSKLAELKKKSATKGGAAKGDKKAAAADPEKAVTKVVFEYSSSKGSIKRSPIDQAESVSKGKSWTCAGAHVADKARHVKMRLTEPGKSTKTSWAIDKAFGNKDHHFMTLTDFKSAWASAMKKQGLENYKGKDGYGDGDGFHLELPDAKIPRSHKDVQTCMDHYAKLTIMDERPHNSSFERSWGTNLKPYFEKYQKLKDAEKLKELMKYRTSGEVSGAGSVCRGAKKNLKFKSPSFANIEPPAPLITGKRSEKQVKARGEAVWDSLARSLFESLGLSPTSGFDVKAAFEISYTLVSFEYLSQSFISNLAFSSEVLFNTPAARFMAMDAKYDVNVKLLKSAKEPGGVIKFALELKTPIDTLKATVGFGIKGGNVGVKVT